MTAENGDGMQRALVTGASRGIGRALGRPWGVAGLGRRCFGQRTPLGLGAGDATLTQYRRSPRGRDCDLRLDSAALAAEALYVEAIAEQLARDEADVAVESYSRRSQAYALGHGRPGMCLRQSPSGSTERRRARSVFHSDDQRLPVKAVS